jgi:hypothetical protein
VIKLRTYLGIYYYEWPLGDDPEKDRCRFFYWAAGMPYPNDTGGFSIPVSRLPTASFRYTPPTPEAASMERALLLPFAFAHKACHGA